MRRPKRSPVAYSVAWAWRDHPDLGFQESVLALDAKQAITRTTKAILEELPQHVAADITFHYAIPADILEAASA